MALIFRLAGKRLGHQFLRHEKSGLLNFVRPVNLQCEPYKPPSNLEGYDERNMKIGRPQSPHLTIYQPQLTSLLSLTHRTTGIVLSFYTIAFGAAAVWLNVPIEHYIEQLRSMELGVPCIFALKFTLALPFTYHFFNGIRHLLWDTGRCLSIREVYATGWAMLALTLISAGILSGMH